MARFIRVRATEAKGCWRAGLYHSTEPMVHNTHELTPDQVRLLRAENGRMLLVDDVDDPNGAPIAPDGDSFTSHPMQEQVDSLTDENARLAAENAELAAKLAEAVEATKAAETARINAEAEVRKAVGKGQTDPPAPKPKPKGGKPKSVDGGADEAATALDGAA